MSAHAPALGLGHESLQAGGPVVLLDLLVLAGLAAGAEVRRALAEDHAVDAVVAAGRLLLALAGLRLVQGRRLHVVVHVGADFPAMVVYKSSFKSSIDDLFPR